MPCLVFGCNKFDTAHVPFFYFLFLVDAQCKATEGKPHTLQANLEGHLDTEDKLEGGDFRL